MIIKLQKTLTKVNPVLFKIKKSCPPEKIISGTAFNYSVSNNLLYRKEKSKELEYRTGNCKQVEYSVSALNFSHLKEDAGQDK